MCNTLGAFFNSVFHVLVISYIYQHSHSTFSKKKKKKRKEKILIICEFHMVVSPTHYKREDPYI